MNGNLYSNDLMVTIRMDERMAEAEAYRQATQVEQKLSQTNDASVDRLYIMNQIDEHRLVLDTIDSRLVPAARRDEVKDLLQTMRPVVADHLQRAQRILDGLK